MTVTAWRAWDDGVDYNQWNKPEGQVCGQTASSAADLALLTLARDPCSAGYRCEVRLGRRRPRCPPCDVRNSFPTKLRETCRFPSTLVDILLPGFDIDRETFFTTIHSSSLPLSY